ncbi:alpha-galactosidase [Paenibacillus gansuensis]|uniref:Alpha-galactosidase n=1 Tax=Paenibacillus gansuensis TaxID=306542 RepID=A0ABW5PI71_9BACL
MMKGSDPILPLRTQWWPYTVLGVLLLSAAVLLWFPFYAQKDTHNGKVTYSLHGSVVQLSNGLAEVEYDLAKGTYLFRTGGILRFSGAAASVTVSDGTQLKTTGSSHKRSLLQKTPLRLQNGFGRGLQVQVLHESAAGLQMLLMLTLYENSPGFQVQTQLTRKDRKPAASQYIAPLVLSRGLSLPEGPGMDGRILNVPYDNDAFIRYESNPLGGGGTSYEVTAVYDNTSRNGLVLGSITHDTWKTGIDYRGKDNRLTELTVYGGASSSVTHDALPHGMVTGTEIRSPLLWVSYDADYRDGLEAYGRANAVIAPKLLWTSGVPFGWNSWSAYREQLTAEGVLQASQFLHDELQPHTFTNEEQVYINMDSYWDNLSEDQLVSVFDTIRANGQKPGMYWTPFTFWGTDFDRVVEGTDGKYRYTELLLKDPEGKVLPPVDNGYALDPSHPGTIARMEWMLSRFLDWGIAYVKLDFLTHGAMEGVHYDPAVQTGTQAYNLGMRYISERIGSKMFISQAISPLFPGQYAHARRISCDAFSSMYDTEYMLNSVSYGWWLNGTVYTFNDPDHMKLTGGTLEEARSRVTSAVIAGTVFLNGDDFLDPEAQKRAKLLLTNPAINELAKSGLSFRPVEGNTGSKAPAWFQLHTPDGSRYAAVFNYQNSTQQLEIPLERLGLDKGHTYTAVNLWTGEKLTVNADRLVITLESFDAGLLQIHER